MPASALELLQRAALRPRTTVHSDRRAQRVDREHRRARTSLRPAHAGDRDGLAAPRLDGSRSHARHSSTRPDQPALRRRVLRMDHRELIREPHELILRAQTRLRTAATTATEQGDHDEGNNANGGRTVPTHLSLAPSSRLAKAYPVSTAAKPGRPREDPERRECGLRRPTSARTGESPCRRPRRPARSACRCYRRTSRSPSCLSGLAGVHRSVCMRSRRGQRVSSANHPAPWVDRTAEPSVRVHSSAPRMHLGNRSNDREGNLPAGIAGFWVICAHRSWVLQCGSRRRGWPRIRHGGAAPSGIIVR